MMYLIYANGNLICPKCTAMIRFMPNGAFWCRDCHSMFFIEGEGVTDKELVLTERKDG